MDVKSASAIVALRPAIESLIVRVSEEPESITSFNETDLQLIEVLKDLCSFNSGRFNLPPISFDQGSRPYFKRQFNEQSSYKPSFKQFKHEGSYNNYRGGYNQGNYSGNFSSFGGRGYNQTGGYSRSPGGRGPGRGSFRGNRRI